jgi:enterochelin esterase-like enzyme
MKTTNILSLVAVVLASKVTATCFSEQLGYPCCQTTTDVIQVDENGQWGIENNNWCGIEANDAVDISSEEEEVDVNFEEGSVVVEDDASSDEEENITPIIDPVEYMSKLNVSNICPEDVTLIKEGVTYPSPEKITYFSTTTNSNRPLNIVLPADYSEDKKYPVVYYLHGIFCNEDTMLDPEFAAIPIKTNLVNEGKAKDFILVVPNTYSPAEGKEVPADFNQEYFDGYDNFINDLINDIMPYVESHYSVLTGRENTAICGFSMGGRNSLYIGYKRPDLFGYVGAFSPAPGVTPGVDFSGNHPGLYTEDEFRTDPQPIVSLISCGTNDSVVQKFPESYHEILTRNNQDHIWFEVPGADHDGPAIKAGYYNFVSSIFGVLNN